MIKNAKEAKTLTLKYLEKELPLFEAFCLEKIDKAASKGQFSETVFISPTAIVEVANRLHSLGFEVSKISDTDLVISWRN